MWIKRCHHIHSSFYLTKTTLRQLEPTFVIVFDHFLSQYWTLTERLGLGESMVVHNNIQSIGLYN